MRQLASEDINRALIFSLLEHDILANHFCFEHIKEAGIFLCPSLLSVRASKFLSVPRNKKQEPFNIILQVVSTHQKDNLDHAYFEGQNVVERLNI